MPAPSIIPGAPIPGSRFIEVREHRRVLVEVRKHLPTWEMHLHTLGYCDEFGNVTEAFPFAHIPAIVPSGYCDQETFTALGRVVQLTPAQLAEATGDFLAIGQAA